MKLNPVEAPLYGECVLTVELEDNEACSSADEEEYELAEFYLLFSGSLQKHLTSTVRVSHVSLQAVCPGHNVCEQVLVVLCVARPSGAVTVCSQENFTFVQDVALDTARLLLNSSSTAHQEPPLSTDPKECKKLDESLVLALKHLTQLHRLSLFSDAQTRIHSPRDELHTKHTQTDNHENTAQSRRTTEEHSTEAQLSNCITEHQQLSGPLLAAADSLNRTDSFIFQPPGARDILRSSANQGQSTACEATTGDHHQRLELFTHSDAGNVNEKLHIDRDGRVFQHHSTLGTFTLTLPGLGQRKHKPGEDCSLQDDVAQLRKHIQEYRDKKGKLEHCGTIIASAASPSFCYNPENLTSSVNENPPPNNGITKPAQESNQQKTSQLDNTAAVTVGQSQETEGSQAARHGRHRRNKKRTAKSTQAVTQSPGSAPEATKGTATDPVLETKAQSSNEQARETTCTENAPKKDLSEIPTSPERDDKSSSRENVALPATSVVEKQEEEKWEVEQIKLDQVTPKEKELGHIENLPTAGHFVNLSIEGATERNDTMGQDQSQTCPETHSENAASPHAGRKIHSKKHRKVQDGSKCGAETAPQWCQGGDSDLMKEEETKSQSVWYDGEQPEYDVSKEMDLSSAQLSEQCVSSRQLSPTLSQPHAAGLEPGVSHGPAAQRQEVHGPQRDEEAGPDWEKSGREEVSTRSKKSSENEEEDDRQGHRDKRVNCKKTKRKKRGKRGGIERRQLSSTSSVESSGQIEIQVTEKNIQTSKYNDKTGRTDNPALSASVTGKTLNDTMHLPSQAQGETTDGTNLSNLGSELTELSGTSDFKLLGEPLETAELALDTAAAQSEEMDVRTTKNIDAPALKTEKREFYVGKDSDILVNKDYIGEVFKGQTNIHPDTFLDQKTVHFVNKPSQLGHPSDNSPENTDFMDVSDPPIDGTADVPPLQTQEGRAEITAQGPSGHCLASEMPGHQQTLEEEENKIELWKEEEAKIGSLQRREKIKLCTNNVAQVEEGPCINSERELAATAVAVVTVAIASAIAKLEIQQQLEETGIDKFLQQKTDETPEQFNKVSDSSLFKEDVNKDQLYSESPAAAETENSQNELNIDFTQEGLTDLNAKGNQEPDGKNQSSTQLCSSEKTDSSLPADSLGLPQTADKKQDLNQDLVALTSNDQNEKECIGLQSSDTNQQNSEVSPKAIEISDPCPVVDTGQGKPSILVFEKPTKEEGSEIAILVEVSPVNVDGEVGSLMLERSLSNESLTNLSQSENLQLTIEEPTRPGDSVCPLIIIQQCPEENGSDTEVAVVMEIKDDDQVDGWRDRERITKDNKEQTISEAGTHSSQKEESTVQIQRETDVFCPAQHCLDDSTQTCTAIPEDGEKLSSVCLQEEGKISLKSPADVEDSVFKEPEEPAPCTEDQKVRVSWSSTDDASSSLGTFSEEPSFTSPDPNTSRLSWKSEAEDTGLGEMEGGEEDENKDQLTANLIYSAILRASHRSLSPSRRHSWEPGRNGAPAVTDMEQSGSLKSLSEEVKPAKSPYHRRSMSWCPSNLPPPDPEKMDNRSYSLEDLEVEQEAGQLPCPDLGEQGDAGRGVHVTGPEEDKQESCHQALSVTSSCPGMFHHQTLTKSVSMVTISHRDVDGSSSFSCNSSTLEYSISEEEPGPLRSSSDAKGGPRISRTFSYLRNKMTKKGKEKEKDKKGEKDRETKERDKKSFNGHMFASVTPPASSGCQHCNRLLQTRECLHCSNCGVHVHKSCKESVAVCAKNKNKLQVMAPEAALPTANTRSKSASSTGSTVSSLSSSSRDRWSTATTPEDQFSSLGHSKRSTNLFTTHTNLSKSISTSNIAGLDDVTLKSLKIRSQSTDSLNQNSAVNASTESLTDEGTEMMDSQLMGEFECDMKDLEADSWSSTVDKKFLKTLKKDEIKRQDVIYELYQTEFHHVRTLRIMSEVYYKGIQKELHLDQHTVDKIFPVLDDLLETHTDFLNQLLEQKRGSSVEGQHNNFIICSIGDTLVKQFSGSSAERMKKVYGKFCSCHNKAVNHYKDLLVKDKHFQPFIKKVMSSTIVRRLSIPECILLVTQRITKYPVLIQRILQHTKEADADHTCVSEALRLVKEIITAVDCKVNEQEKKRRLKEVYSRTDSKSIMRMKSGQMFAREDLIRARRLLHDGALQLKNTAGRLKDVHSLLLSDVLVFLQEKDQKYVFASLDQRSTVISLQNLIVREVANEERGLFLISAGTEKPEMVEVLASSKEERNTWRAIIQDAMNCMEKDEDEGIPSETEEDRRQQESRAKEIRELLRSKDKQIVSLLEEKVHIFRELSDCTAALHDACPAVRERMLFRATPDEVTKGEPIIQEALREVESLHSLVNTGLGGAGCSVPISPVGGGVGPVCLPRRAETFGGFDSHQMNISKNGEKEEADESVDLRRTESDGVLKKGATASLQLLLKRNNEQVQSSVTHLHDLLLSLQAVVVQQDSFIEDQRQALNERLTSSRHSSSSSLSSISSSRPSSLIEQEKHRSLERQRQEAANLQKQQTALLEEKRRREREWDVKDKVLSEREQKVKEEEDRTEKRRRELQEERDLHQRNREQYQREVERLKEAQMRLERDKEALKRDTDRLEAQRREQAEQLHMYSRTSSITSEDSVRFPSTTSLDLDCRDAAEQAKEVELSSSAPTKEPFLRIGSKRMSKNFNPFASSSSKTQGAEKEPSRLLQLTKSKKDKDKKEKKDKKKKKGGEGPPTGAQATVMSDPQNDGDIYFC